MKLLLVLPAAAAAISVSLQADLGKMKESLRTVALNAQQSGTPIDDTTKGIVRNMTNQIKAELEEALAADKAASQKKLDDALAGVNRCLTDRTTTFGGVVSTANQRQQRAGGEFHSCKNVEVGLGHVEQPPAPGPVVPLPATGHVDPPSLVPEAPVPPSLIQQDPNHDYGYELGDWHTDGTLGHSAHEKQAHDAEVEACGRVNTTVKTYTDKVRTQTQGEWCFPDEADPWDKIYAENVATVTTSSAWFEHMDNFESTEAEKYFREREDCHLKRDIHSLRVVECTRLQHVFEFDYCEWSRHIDETCSTYASCYRTQYAAWENTTAIVQEEEIQFKAQQHALEHILCYSEEILKDVTNIANCDLPNCEHCSPDLDIVYLDPHDQVPCSEDNGDNEPCGADWVQANYGIYTNGDVPVDTCVACA